MIDYINLGPWRKGMNTLLRSEALPEDTARNIVNMDVDDTGRVRTRAGSTKVYNGTIVKDTFWSNGDVALFVEGGDLKQLNNDFTATTLRSGVGYSPMRYVCVNSVVYYTNGVVTGLVRNGASEPWGVQPPAQQPTLTAAATSSGSLSAGIYQVAVTFISPTGEESGTGVSAEVTVEDNGAIQLSAIPQPPAGHTIRVYVSAVDGEKLFSRAVLLPGQLTYMIYEVANQTGRLLETQFGMPPPAGTDLTYLDGRIYIADGNVVWFTEPLRYGLVKRAKDFLLYSEPVTMLKAVAGGVYIAADMTYFVSGLGTDGLAQKEALLYGAVRGPAVDIERTTEGAIRVAWWSERGLCIGGPDGDVANIMEDSVAVSDFERAALLFREQDGIRSILACLQGGTASKYAVSDYVTDETARRGNAI